MKTENYTLHMRTQFFMTLTNQGNLNNQEKEYSVYLNEKIILDFSRRIFLLL